MGEKQGAELCLGMGLPEFQSGSYPPGIGSNTPVYLVFSGTQLSLGMDSAPGTTSFPSPRRPTSYFPVWVLKHVCLGQARQVPRVLSLDFGQPSFPPCNLLLPQKLPSDLLSIQSVFVPQWKTPTGTPRCPPAPLILAFLSFVFLKKNLTKKLLVR